MPSTDNAFFLHFCKLAILYITKPLNARLAPLGNSIETRWYKMATESVFHSKMTHSYCFLILSNVQALLEIYKSSSKNYKWSL